METKNKGGRPKLTPERKRSVPVHFKVTPTEYQKLKDKAELSGLTLSMWLRLRTLDFQKLNQPGA